MALDTPVRGPRLVGRYVMLAVIAVLVLFPVYTMVVAALKPGTKALRTPLVPSDFTLQTLSDAWTEGHLGRYMFNSIVVAIIVTAAQLVTSVLAAYAFAFLQFPFKRLIFVLFLATLLVPAEVTLVVNRRTVDSLGWIDTYRGLTVPFLASAFGIFLLRQVFMSLPAEMREAAAMDGVGHLGFLREVAVPMVRPTLGALALFSFLGTWNQYLWPTLVTTEQDMNTVQSGLRTLSKNNIDAPNLVMAGTLIAAIPIVVVLLVFQRQLIRGLTAGAVKG